MPNGLPTAAQAREKVTFFSIDTNLIQAAGYNFKEGALHQLPRQLPESMALRLPEIVLNEIVKHRMDSVAKANSQLKSAATDLQRLTTVDVSAVHNSLDQLNIIETARQQFTQGVHDYVSLCRGSVLPAAGADAAKSLFADYFAERPPFEAGKKKSEFPDAMCLWLLEQYANDNHTMGIIASNDRGWQQYAEGSKRLYCASSIEQLSALFAATNEHAEAIKAKIAAAVADSNSPLGIALIKKLNYHVANSQWDCSEVYSGLSSRLDAEFYDATVAEHDIGDSVNIWSMEGEPTTWVVELTVQLVVDVHISVEFLAWDSIDREELSLGSQDFKPQQEISVDIYLTCKDVRLDTQPNDWHTEIEIADGEYLLEGFEAEFDYGDPDE